MHAVELHDREGFETAVAGLAEADQMALAVADIDHFLEINETYGKDAGDAVLRSWERTLTRSVPGDAVVGRISGDEYAVALPDTSAEAALILLEEIRAHFSADEPTPKVPRRVEVSVGVAAKPQHVRSVPDLMRAADEALYRAKREGRGRVAIYVENKMVLKSNYYARASLERLAKLSAATGRTEASLLREALDDLLAKHGDQL